MLKPSNVFWSPTKNQVKIMSHGKYIIIGHEKSWKTVSVVTLGPDLQKILGRT